MNRPSNVIILFILAVVASLMTWIGWLTVANLFQSPEVEVESQLEERNYTLARSKRKTYY